VRRKVLLKAVKITEQILMMNSIFFYRYYRQVAETDLPVERTSRNTVPKRPDCTQKSDELKN
jgi:hypothetical protein